MFLQVAERGAVRAIPSQVGQLTIDGSPSVLDQPALRTFERPPELGIVEELFGNGRVPPFAARRSSFRKEVSQRSGMEKECLKSEPITIGRVKLCGPF